MCLHHDHTRYSDRLRSIYTPSDHEYAPNYHENSNNSNTILSHIWIKNRPSSAKKKYDQSIICLNAELARVNYIKALKGAIRKLNVRRAIQCADNVLWKYERCASICDQAVGMIIRQWSCLQHTAGRSQIIDPYMRPIRLPSRHAHDTLDHTVEWSTPIVYTRH